MLAVKNRLAPCRFVAEIGNQRRDHVRRPLVDRDLGLLDDVVGSCDVGCSEIGSLPPGLLMIDKGRYHA